MGATISSIDDTIQSANGIDAEQDKKALALDIAEVSIWNCVYAFSDWKLFTNRF